MCDIRTYLEEAATRTLVILDSYIQVMTYLHSIICMCEEIAAEYATC